MRIGLKFYSKDGIAHPRLLAGRDVYLGPVVQQQPALAKGRLWHRRLRHLSVFGSFSLDRIAINLRVLRWHGLYVELFN